MHQILIAAALLTATAKTSKHFHIGPWIIVPILMLIALIATPIYVVRDRRRRRSNQHTALRQMLLSPPSSVPGSNSPSPRSR